MTARPSPAASVLARGTTVRLRIAPSRLARLRPVAIAAACLAVLASGGRVGAAPDACSTVTAGDDGQDCATLAALPKPTDGDPADTALGAGAAAPLPPDAFRPAASRALAAEPASFLHRPIALEAARCFYFAVGDYRCLSRGAVPVAVRTAIVIPPTAEAAVERSCTGHAPADCARRILFVPTAFQTAGAGDRTVVVFRTGNVTVAPEEAAGR